MKSNRRVKDVLKIVGLDGLEDRPAPKLSGGQQQRVAFARALINEPKVMLLDEPLSNLDAKLRVQMRSEIKSLQRRTNITTIFVTHDQAEALAISDQIAVMHGGKLIEVGSPHQLYSPSEKAIYRNILGADQPDRRQSAGSGRRFQARQNGNQKGHLEFHSGARAEKRPSGGHFDSAGKYSVAQRKTACLGKRLEGTVKEAIFMGDAYHCKIAVGDDLLAVHTHPFQSR